MLQFAQAAPEVPDLSFGTAPQGRPFTPTSVRLSVAELVANDRLGEAETLTRTALEAFPRSEEVLVMRALVCEVRQDWATAAEVLESLVALQGPKAPAETWCHWVRVLRCQGLALRALAVVRQGLAAHPGHPVLAGELASLQQRQAA